MASAGNSNWGVVSEFVSELRNASRLAALADAVVEMYESGAWRRYQDATGAQDEWKECEYDYFLIACGAQYADVQRLLAWDKARAASLAAAMESDDPARRRSFEEAAAAWHSPAGTSLAEVALRNGWLNRRGELRVPPAPERARAVARHGMSMDEHARRRREELLAPRRREELNSLVAEISHDLPDLELRYLRDCISATLKTRGRGRNGASDVTGGRDAHP